MMKVELLGKAIASAGAAMASFVALAVAPDALTVEYRTDPVGLDAARPRLSWHMAAEPGAKNERQTAYRVLVASSAVPGVFDCKGRKTGLKPGLNVLR